MQHLGGKEAQLMITNIRLEIVAHLICSFKLFILKVSCYTLTEKVHQEIKER